MVTQMKSIKEKVFGEGTEVIYVAFITECLKLKSLYVLRREVWHYRVPEHG